MNSITIDVNSKLYKLFDFARRYSMAGMIIDIDYTYDENGKLIETFDSFTDVCTFVRHFIIGILLLLPITILFVSIILFFILYIFVWMPIATIIGFGDVGQTYAGYSILTMYGFIIISYFVLCLLQHKAKNKISTPLEENKEMGTFGKISQIISAKHSKFCTRIKTIDISKNNS